MALRDTDTRGTRVGLAVVALVCLGKIGLAARWNLLADEAYYAVWSEHLALGYFDQPPLIAWVIGAMRTLWGDSDLAVRLPALACGAVVPLALLPWATQRTLWCVWASCLPPLAFLTGFVTPDAFLLAGWAVALAGALHGGRGWLVAGAAVAFAFYAKYTAVLLFPLLMLGAGDWRSRWMWMGATVALLAAVPHLAWLGLNEAPSVGYALSEGLFHAAPPGTAGPPAVIGQQLLVATPFAILILAGMRPGLGRVSRLLWWTSAPVFGWFVLAALGGPPEAHWVAPAWISVGLAASRATDWRERAGWLGGSVGLLISLLIVAHAELGLVRLRLDPANRVWEGRPLAAAVAAWALPEGVGMREPRATEAQIVLTERYQEAALIRWYAGIDARAYPGCAREDQYDHWDAPIPERFLFVRPTTSGDAICADPCEKRRHRLAPLDSRSRPVGVWDLFEVEK